MLKLMRDSFHHLKWILLAIVAAFIIGFVYVDMGLGGAMQADESKNKSFAARVNGETIPRTEYDRAMAYQQRRLEAQYRQPLTPDIIAAMGLNKQVLDGIVDRHLMLQEAARLHLNATPEEVRQRILEIPDLNTNGKFVGTEYYERFVAMNRYNSAAEFEQALAGDITEQKFESALASSVIISPKSAEAEYKRLSESSAIRYVLYPAAREAASITLTPAEIQAYYDANKGKYAHGEQRDIKYLLADVNLLRSQIHPTEEDLRKRYEAGRETTYKRQESARILHILVKVDEKAPEAEQAAAKAKAESLVKELRAGGDFAKLAQANSGDPSSAAKGGDMGYIDRGMTVKPFEDAAFSIPLNTISDPIHTEFGYHIIKVIDRKPAGYRSYEEVKTGLMNEAADQAAKDQARQAITDLQQRIKANKPKTADAFSALANVRVTSNETKWFGKTDPIPGLANNAAVANWAFAANIGDVGDPIGTSRGPAIPYLLAIRPAGISPFDEVKQKVEADARKAKAAERAREALTKALPAANVDEVAKKVGLPAVDANVPRTGYVGGFTGDTSALIDAATKAPVGQLVGPVVVGDGAVVFQVTKQNKVESKPDQTQQYIEGLRRQQVQNLRTVLLQRLRKSSKIEINNALLDENRAAGNNPPPTGL